MTTLSKTFFTRIEQVQQSMLVLSFLILVALPLLLAYVSLGQSFYTYLFSLSLWSAFFVLAIRPLADLFPQVLWLRPLVILRKGFGTFSASFIVAIMISKFITYGNAHLMHYVAPEAWSLTKATVLATLADISAVILLVTSNKFSKRVLGENWKRVQKLAYVYFYFGALYEYIVYHSLVALSMVCVVGALSLGAFVYKRRVVLLQTI